MPNAAFYELTSPSVSVVPTGIFERHKLLFSFLLASKLEQDVGNLVQNQLDFFLKGNVNLESPKEENPFDWLTNDNWRNLTHLEERLPETFQGITSAMTKNEMKWQTWVWSHRPERGHIPKPFSKIKPIDRLCLLRCFRIDRIYNAIVHYVVTVR